MKMLDLCQYFIPPSSSPVLTFSAVVIQQSDHAQCSTFPCMPILKLPFLKHLSTSAYSPRLLLPLVCEQWVQRVCFFLLLWNRINDPQMTSPTNELGEERLNSRHTLRAVTCIKTQMPTAIFTRALISSLLSRRIARRNSPTTALSTRKQYSVPLTHKW